MFASAPTTAKKMKKSAGGVLAKGSKLVSKPFSEVAGIFKKKEPAEKKTREERPPSKELPREELPAGAQTAGRFAVSAAVGTVQSELRLANCKEI